MNNPGEDQPPHQLDPPDIAEMEEEFEDEQEGDDSSDDNSAVGRADFETRLADSWYDSGQEDDEDKDEDAPQQEFEPSYKLANSLWFHRFAKALDYVSKAKRSPKNTKTDKDLLESLLPPLLLEKFRCPTNPNQQPESIYPLLRLMIPKRDGHRGDFRFKETTLAHAYIAAHGMTGKDKEKLLHFADPVVVSKDEGLGDFSSVVETVMTKALNRNEFFYSKFMQDPAQGFNVGQINNLLDKLVGLGAKVEELNTAAAAERHVHHEYHSSNKKVTLTALRRDLIKELNPYSQGQGGMLGLSPLEHKWLVRMILGSFKIGFGEDRIMNWYNKASQSLWMAHNSLKGVCNKLVDPRFINALQLPTDMEGENAVYLTAPTQPIQFGQVFQPMCSKATDFVETMTLISNRHRDFNRSLDSKVPYKDALALLHPAFTIETKLDGERMIVHMRRDGQVKIHTRKSNWYSELYSPVLGPDFRKAVGKHTFDIVLDGEILSWFNGAICGETIQFGLNRTVANKRREWMEVNGLIDDRDMNIEHNGENKVMNRASSVNRTKTKRTVELEEGTSGESCWLTFVAFDIVFLDGPGAAEFLDETVSKCVHPRPSPGSLLALSAMERKKILYRLIDVQANRVEIVDTQVVRPNGRMVKDSDYFNFDNPIIEFGLPIFELDSLECCRSGIVPNLTEIDIARRARRSDDEISQERARNVDLVYKQTVDELKLEGVMFKDLSTPYVLGEQSRSLRYWMKLKPDYVENHDVSDLDVVIVGGYFATGLSRAGLPSTFLVACRDSLNPDLFFPFCKISAGTVKRKVCDVFLDSTGYDEYKGDTTEVGQCKWFSGRELKKPPDFITQHSFQRDCERGDWDGWKWDKSTKPDIWIHPQNSAIATVKAGEFAESGAFPTGVTLRFPRIERLRNEELGGEKDLSTILSEADIRQSYEEFDMNRTKSSNNNDITAGSPSRGPSNQPCRFLTEKQAKNARNAKTTTSSRKKAPKGVKVVADLETKSNALAGLSFVILQGKYKLREGSADWDLAHEEGWFDEACMVADRIDIEAFVKSHGATTLLVKKKTDDKSLVLGGRLGDLSVAAYKEFGVLRWTFVYSVVSRWKRAYPHCDDSVKIVQPSLLEPHLLDYLARPHLAGHDELTQLCSVELSNETQLRRALEVVETFSMDNDTFNGPWQYEAMKHLPELGEAMILFPDVFRPGDYGLVSESDAEEDIILAMASKRWKETRQSSGPIMSTLPLARATGALVTPHLYRGVTHVVCNLSGGRDFVSSAVHATAESFEDSKNAVQLLEKLQALESESNSSIKLVSPDWIRKRMRE